MDQVRIKFTKKVKFNEYAWLKPYIDMNNDLRKKTKHDFGKKKLS